MDCLWPGQWHRQSPDQRWLSKPLTERVGGITLPGMTWVDQNTIVFATGDPTTGLLSIAASGGDPRVLTKPDPSQGEEDHILPQALPGRRVLFTAVGRFGADTFQVGVLDLATSERKILIRGASAATYVPTGHIVYAAGGGLRAVRFNPSTLEVGGDSIVVVDSVAIRPNGAADYAVSPSGTLVYCRRRSIGPSRHGRQSG